MKKKSTSQITIRRARNSDLPEIFQLAEARELAPPNKPLAERIWIRDHLRAKQILLVAVNKKDIIGFSMGEKLVSQVVIHHLLIVHHRWRRQGVATKLLQSLEREAKRRRASCILGYGVVSSKGIHRLLKKHHYQAGSLVREYQKFL